MSTLQVANLNFESTGNNQIRYAGSNTVQITAAGANVFVANSTYVLHQVAGANAMVVNSTSITYSINPSVTALTAGANVTVNATGVYVGNATVNAVHSATQLSIANSTANVQLGLTVSGGFSVNAYNIGVVSSGNTTPAPGNGNYQYMIANGAFTMVAPATDCAIDIYLLNGSAAGSITFSGYTVSAAPGSPYATTNANKYVLSIRRINSVSTYSWYAMQ